VPRFDQTALADAVSDWWIELLARLTRVGIDGFRCLTLDLVPALCWRRMIATFPEALFLGLDPRVGNLPAFDGIGFDLTCSSAGWWDGRASWFLDEQMRCARLLRQWRRRNRLSWSA
jgi:starch synthase (maltosyl-transferring)